MRVGSTSDLDASRVLRVARRLAIATGALFAAMVIPELAWWLPEPVLNRPTIMCMLLIALIYASARAVRARALVASTHRDRLNRLLGFADRAADAALSGGLTLGASILCLVFLATWLPHYLLWPWYRDADTFATLARSWEVGILPYRDVRAYNFPGAIYLYWALGRLFGWGRTWPLYAFDAAALTLLGLMLAEWSRRILGGRLPGLAGYLAFLTYYLSLDYQLVAGRDWLTSLCIGLALLSLQGWPSTASRIVSAALAAVALSVRPHAILFLPALVSAVLESADAERSARGKAPARPLLSWSLLLGSFTLAAFAPVIVAGIADDLARSLRIVSYGGPYSRTDLASGFRVLAEELSEPRTLMEIAGILVVAVAGRRKERRIAITWALALGAALVYQPIHPMQHRYLALPLDLIGCISIAPPIAWILEQVRTPSVLRACAAVALIGEASLGWPIYCHPNAMVQGLRALSRGEYIPVESPPGSWVWFNLANGRWYPWKDYRDALMYLQARTSPEMVVANVLTEPPFPSINGPTGCLSPFRAESGLCWMLHVSIDLEPEFAAALESQEDCLVVWSPELHSPARPQRLDHLISVIRARYRPEARFGRIEVWRRADPMP